jgi:hypothetical protein
MSLKSFKSKRSVAIDYLKWDEIVAEVGLARIEVVAERLCLVVGHLHDDEPLLVGAAGRGVFTLR